ncbi:MAG: VacJ family lipoprotein [Desulfobacteraceae bacterium]|nr:MAG: VacJ family lipoprotein [Desulfobacteraceae bacterium]
MSEPTSYPQQGNHFLVLDANNDYLIVAVNFDNTQSQNTVGRQVLHPNLSQAEKSKDADEEFDDIPQEEFEEDFIADPLEPINRIFFHFNDKLYFWVLKPVATGYKKVAPEPLRISVRNFFSNLFTPIRAVNCLLQGKFKGFGNELLRFVANSTVGMLGFMDPAKTALNLEKQDEDFGQTLGLYGLGPGFFINWPILGPSSLRGTVGVVGDGFIDPLNYLVDSTLYNAATRGYEQVNTTSLTIGEYESLKKAALDPYVSLRDAYYQYRKNKIKK